MIRINIRTNDKVKVKSFTNKNDLSKYICTDILFYDYEVGNPKVAQDNSDKLADKIWETKVGQSVKTEMGHIISVSGKSRAGKYLVL